MTVKRDTARDLETGRARKMGMRNPNQKNISIVQDLRKRHHVFRLKLMAEERRETGIRTQT